MGNRNDLAHGQACYSHTTHGQLSVCHVTYILKLHLFSLSIVLNPPPSMFISLVLYCANILLIVELRCLDLYYINCSILDLTSSIDQSCKLLYFIYIFTTNCQLYAELDMTTILDPHSPHIWNFLLKLKRLIRSSVWPSNECTIECLYIGRNYIPYKSIQDFFKWFK